MRQSIRLRIRTGVAFLLCQILLVGPAAPAWALAPDAASAHVDRALDDAEMAGIVGGGGGGPTPITFGEVRQGTVSSDGAVVKYGFTAPVLGPNASIAVTFQVSDLSGAGGTYALDVFDVTDQLLLYSVNPPGGGDPTRLEDATLPAEHQLEVRVIEVDGPIPRSFEIAMSHRYTLPPEPLPPDFDDSEAYTFENLEFVTLSLDVAAGQTGETDLYFDDQGIPGTNVVRVLGPDRITLKAEDSRSNDVNFDNSNFPDLAFDEPGEYLIVVSNTKTDIAPPADSFIFFVGPYPGQDDVLGPCEVVPAPTFTQEVVISTRSLFRELDRDCFQFETPDPFTELGFSLEQLQVLGGSGANEVRVFQEDELEPGKIDFVSRKTGSGSLLNKTVDVSANQSGSDLIYQVVVNNLKTKTIDYRLTLRIEGPCLGPTCALAPRTSVDLDLSSGVDVVPIRAETFGGDPLPTDAAASFQFDKTSSGTFKVTIRGMRGGVLTDFCMGEDNADFFLENCDLTTDDGLPEAVIERTAGGGSSGILRMGPDVVNDNDPPIPSALETVESGELDTFGAEDVYAFTLAVPGRLGLGFDEAGIGKGQNLVRVYDEADLEAALRSPGPPPAPLVEFVSTGDGGVPQLPPEEADLPAGDYVLIVDNDGLGTGDYSVCVGPSPSQDPEDTGSGIPPFGDLSGEDEVEFTGDLRCGDTDYVAFSTSAAAAHHVKIVVKEDVSGIPGHVSVDVQVLGAGGSWITIASKSARRTATLRDVPVQPGESYRLVIDNVTIGAPAYTVTITDDD